MYSSPAMITNQNLLFTCSSLLILLLHFSQTSQAKPHCPPSACGIISNISSPFRLKGDPKHCGDRRAELACESNVTSIYLNSRKYYVKEINYHNPSIRLVDASINNHTCSFPLYSAYDYIFTRYSYPYGYPHSTRNSSNPHVDVAWPINFMSCPRPLKNSSLFTDITDCVSNSSHAIYTYIRVGHMKASEVTETCRLDLILMTSWKFNDSNNVSLSEIHHSLLYGFQLIFCSDCMPFYTKWEKFGIFLFSLLLIHVFIVGLCAVASPPVLTIIGFTAVLGLLASTVVKLYYMIHDGPTDPPTLVILIEFIILAPRIIIFPFALWLLIYKFRRRHLSEYDTIESFLQSENKLMPIKYSYSDIKKMTRGFQDKLGEGGYGSVYKGKLRSGHDVAVKLLKKSGANGQDFMNEIATIGRIHHVNVIKLVGYCAQGSKRALVFDFMSNGSLEKYIFNREKMNSFNWDKKFEIAVGVARGIDYLHQGCDIQILHFDIKPHNILLDDEFVPKISDFGLAKFCSTEKNTVTLTAARGTIGYVAPELINRSIGVVSYKADVYSFGMMLIEMVSLKRDLIENNCNSSQYFPHWIYDCINQGKAIKVGNGDENNNIDENDSTRKLIRKVTIVALWCIQMNPDDRPSMNKVLKMLEGDVELLQIPVYPSQSTHTVVDVYQSGTSCSTDSLSLLRHDDEH